MAAMRFNEMRHRRRGRIAAHGPGPAGNAACPARPCSAGLGGDVGARGSGGWRRGCRALGQLAATAMFSAIGTFGGVLIANNVAQVVAHPELGELPASERVARSKQHGFSGTRLAGSRGGSKPWPCLRNVVSVSATPPRETA